ncbi:hypothetical protein LSG31_00760 [Fodinisporobacter ferrooxydans]|uniref:Uncharacterized protein n=1 Tax=Fodinisporobacter ferrooxydans TaxID=2901836 RepID=A0ABY4CKB4_9BACL|nr:hypothetical protein LSG31_00760 [Alicyclobacillaceae bacterium MYW30-H2]
MNNELKSLLQSVLTEALEPIHKELQTLNSRVGTIESELKEFRQETEANFQVLKAGNEGLREQVSQRAKETKDQIQHAQETVLHEINDIKLDVEFTYEKTARNELALKRLQAKQ